MNNPGLVPCKVVLLGESGIKKLIKKRRWKNKHNFKVHQ